MLVESVEVTSKFLDSADHSSLATQRPLRTVPVALMFSRSSMLASGGGVDGGRAVKKTTSENFLPRIF